MFFLWFRDASGTFILTFVPHHLGNVLSSKLSQQSPGMSPLYGM